MTEIYRCEILIKFNVFVLQTIKSNEKIGIHGKIKAQLTNYWMKWIGRWFSFLLITVLYFITKIQWLLISKISKKFIENVDPILKSKPSIAYLFEWKEMIDISVFQWWQFFILSSNLWTNFQILALYCLFIRLKRDDRYFSFSLTVIYFIAKIQWLLISNLAPSSTFLPTSPNAFLITVP